MYNPNCFRNNDAIILYCLLIVCNNKFFYIFKMIRVYNIYWEIFKVVHFLLFIKLFQNNYLFISYLKYLMHTIK